MIKKPHGFTAVELLIMIVAIAILSGVVYVGYRGVTDRAVEVSMKNDLKNLASRADLIWSNDGSFLATIDEISYDSNDNNTLTYNLRPYGYCIEVQNDTTNNTYILRSDTGTTEEGDCSLVLSDAADYANVLGYLDGPAATAEFHQTEGSVMNKAGELFISDGGNARIRKLSTDGIVSTFVGNGDFNTIPGAGTSASFNVPKKPLIDGQGNIYFSSYGSNYIMKVTPDGLVTIFADSYGGLTGVMDAQGNIYTYSFNDNFIYKVTNTGFTSVFAGTGVAGYADGPAATAQFDRPRSLAISSSGDLYVADFGNNLIRKITPDGIVSTYAGSGGGGRIDGPASTAEIGELRAIVMDDTDTLWILSKNGNTYLRRISPDLQVTTMGGIDKSGNEVSLLTVDEPTDLYLAPNNNTFYICSLAPGRVSKINL